MPLVVQLKQVRHKGNIIVEQMSPDLKSLAKEDEKAQCLENNMDDRLVLIPTNDQLLRETKASILALDPEAKFVDGIDFSQAPINGNPPPIYNTISHCSDKNSEEATHFSDSTAHSDQTA